MKLSVSISDADVVLLDEYARANGLRSRSAAVQHAIHLLRHPDLEDDYAAAWADWEAGDDAQPWEAATADGLTDGLADASR